MKILRKGIECLDEIKNDVAFHTPGQGLYIWTNKTFLDAGKNAYKFGQYGALGTGKTPDVTINSYVGTTIDTVIIIHAVKLDDYLKSSQNINRYKNAYEIEQIVGKAIIKSGGYKETYGKSTELFAGKTIDEIKKIINGVLYNAEKTLDFKMRDEQKAAHDQIVKQFNAGKKEFLLAAKMRYGKNFTFLNVAKTMGMKNILVLTYKPQVFESLKDDIESHVLFDGWNFVEFKNQRNLSESKNVPRVIVSSAQLAQYKSEDEKENEKLSIDILSKNIQALSNIHFDMIVADEYHYGTGTHNFKKVLEQLNYDRMIWVSGTAMKDIQQGRFDDEDIFVWDYINEQKKKREGSRFHQDMPSMELHLMHIDERAKAVGDFYTEEEGFTMAKLISTNADGTLKDNGSLKILLQQIRGTGVHSQMSPYRSINPNPDHKNCLDHTFWVFDKNVKGIMATAKLMQSMHEYDNFEIITATGGAVTDINVVKEKINEAKDKKRGTITLSCYRFKEGVTVPEWDGVIMLDSGKSIEEYLQAIFRSQNPDAKRGKDKCYVFDFNPQRCLQMIYDTCENVDKTGKKALGQTIKEFLDYAPILDHVDNILTKVDFNKVIENFRMSGSFSEKFANVKNINIEKIDEDIIGSLSTVVAGQRKKEIEINQQDIELGKTAIQTRVDSEESDEEIIQITKVDVKKYLQKISGVLSNIPEYLFNSPEKEKTVDDILNGKELDLFNEITGVPLSVFKMWVEKKLINEVLLNRNIFNFNDAEEKFINSNFTLEEKNSFFNRHFNMKAESGVTPAALVNEKLDKLPKEIWEDKYKKFCDPCMGTGTFVIGIKERLMKGLENVITNEQEREKWIIEEMIWCVDVDRSKYLITKKLMLKTNEYKHHIIQEDSLKINWNNLPKFNVCVQNAPYKGTLHLKFLKLGFNMLKDNGKMIIVHPSTWLLDKKGLTKIYVEIKELIKNNVVDFTFMNFRKYFDIHMFTFGLITFIDKEKNDPKIKVIDTFDNKEIIYDEINQINFYSDLKIFPNLRKKIIELSNINNFGNYIDNENSSFYITRNIILGHPNYTDDKRTNSDFFRLTTKVKEPVLTIKPKRWFSFKTKKEAENCRDFLKTKWAMFCAGLNRVDQNMEIYQWRTLPWLNWNENWTKDKLYKLINATSEEIDFIEKNIPDFD